MQAKIGVLQLGKGDRHRKRALPAAGSTTPEKLLHGYLLEASAVHLVVLVVPLVLHSSDSPSDTLLAAHR